MFHHLNRNSSRVIFLNFDIWLRAYFLSRYKIFDQNWSKWLDFSLNQSYGEHLCSLEVEILDFYHDPFFLLLPSTELSVANAIKIKIHKWNLILWFSAENAAALRCVLKTSGGDHSRSIMISFLPLWRLQIEEGARGNVKALKNSELKKVLFRVIIFTQIH